MLINKTIINSAVYNHHQAGEAVHIAEQQLAINFFLPTLSPKKSKFTFIDLFAGIGGFHSAADALGGHCVFASEIDAEAQRAYQANYGIVPFGDITAVNPISIPNHDLLLAGFPCQPFSIIGKRKGFDDIRGTLFFEIAKILSVKKPRSFVLENVKQLMTHNQGKTLAKILETLADLGYKTYYKNLGADLDN